MASSKAVNTIPQEYLRYSQNLRIYDWGIGPRRWKVNVIDSTIWTKNAGWFVINWTLYQVTNSKIYEIDTINNTQTEKVDLWYDSIIDVMTYADFAIIVSDWEPLKVFDGTTIIEPLTVPADNSWIIEFTNNYSFLVDEKTLYISRPILPDNPEYAYDFTDTAAQQIAFEDKIVWLKATLSWLFVITEKKVEFLWANSLQNVAWSAAFISQPIWDWWNLVNNLCMAASWDKLFYLTKSLDIESVNYASGVDNPLIRELSSQPIVGIKELLSGVDHEQPSAFAIYNENENNIQFHVRTIWSPFNNISIVYDLINKTWNVDTWKYYNYIVKKQNEYFGFSDVNSSIYNDWVGFSDAWIPITTKWITQAINYGTANQKLFGWFFTAWSISPINKLNYICEIDEENVFEDSVIWQSYKWGWFAWHDIAWIDIAWDEYISNLQPFNILADEWRIYLYWDRVSVEFWSDDQIQDWIVDTLGFRYEISWNINIENKW